MLITEILARNARMYGEEVALIERDPAEERRREMSWREFNRLADQVAEALFQMGVTKGDRVTLLMTNCLEWLPVYFGILRAGAWAVPLNFRFDAQTILTCSATARASVMVFGVEFVDRIESVHGSLVEHIQHFLFVGPEDSRPTFCLSFEETVRSLSGAIPSAPVDISDNAALYFTSGTTGMPKATLLTHRNLEFACFLENIHHHQTHDDNFLCIPPLYHTGAKMHWFGNFVVGARAVILKGIEPQWILDAISEERVTVVWLLVPWALDILFAVESGDIKLSRYRLDQWRLMHIGAQPVPPSLIQEWKRLFPHHQYDTNYGLTESTGPGCVHLGIENMHKVGAIGKPGFDWEARICDDSLRPVKQGEAGELLVRGPGVMKAYYGNPEETEKALVDGWLLTGDIVREDSDGFLWLVDRKKDIIITGGENIYPVEIEDYLQTHPDIQDAAVIGLPSLRLGEIAAAVIQVKPGHTLTTDDVGQFCRQLPRYKRPRRIIFDDVPRNPTGKIEKPKLRAIYGQGDESKSARRE